MADQWLTIASLRDVAIGTVSDMFKAHENAYNYQVAIFFVFHEE